MEVGPSRITQLMSLLRWAALMSIGTFRTLLSGLLFIQSSSTCHLCAGGGRQGQSIQPREKNHKGHIAKWDSKLVRWRSTWSILLAFVLVVLCSSKQLLLWLTAVCGCYNHRTYMNGKLLCYLSPPHPLSVSILHNDLPTHANITNVDSFFIVKSGLSATKGIIWDLGDINGFVLF